MYFSKPALLEGLEVDQYMWSVIQNQQCADADEVQIDNQANMKPLFIKVRFVEMPFGDYRPPRNATAYKFVFPMKCLIRNCYFRVKVEPVNQTTRNKSNQSLQVLSNFPLWVRGTFLIPSPRHFTPLLI